MLLADAIEGNPNTKFILFHGGYPWTHETAGMAFSYRNVWIDSNWLVLVSDSTAKLAYHEWLDAVPSDRIFWGADCTTAEGIYGATVQIRRCLSEVLAERVIDGRLREDHAIRIARQILRDNALKLFPSLQRRVTNH